MEYDRYTAFLPAEYRIQPVPEPISTWWPWQGRQVHIARVAAPGNKIRALVLHGAGGHAGALWPVAALAAAQGADVLVPDLPLYGDTVEPRPRAVRYDDWVDLLVDLVAAEDDGRPLVIAGASMGGLLGYEVAARTGRVAHVVATCLLDPADPAAQRAAARFAPTARIAAPMLGALDPIAGDLRVPIRWLVNMNAMSRNTELSRLCATDPKGGGVRIPLGFLSSWLHFRHTRPEEFTAAPVTLVHPALDQWTPPRLSIRFLDRIPGPKDLVLLENCGHFPIEQPGVDQLVSTLRRIRDELLDQPDQRFGAKAAPGHDPV